MEQDLIFFNLKSINHFVFDDFIGYLFILILKHRIQIMLEDLLSKFYFGSYFTVKDFN